MLSNPDCKSNYKGEGFATPTSSRYSFTWDSSLNWTKHHAKSSLSSPSRKGKDLINFKVDNWFHPGLSGVLSWKMSGLIFSGPNNCRAIQSKNIKKLWETLDYPHQFNNLHPLGQLKIPFQRPFGNDDVIQAARWWGGQSRTTHSANASRPRIGLPT